MTPRCPVLTGTGRRTLSRIRRHQNPDTYENRGIRKVENTRSQPTEADDCKVPHRAFQDEPIQQIADASSQDQRKANDMEEGASTRQGHSKH